MQSPAEAAMASVRFEIQMRTALQHVWSAIEHDIGYKGVVKLPPELRRQFSRLAGLLKLADDAYQLVLSQLATTGLDILADSVGLQNLCLVHTLKQGKGMAMLV